MNVQQTLDQLRELRMPGMAAELELQLSQPNTYNELSFIERLALLTNNETTSRKNSKIKRLIAQAKLRINAEINEIDYSGARGITKDTVTHLLQRDWINRHRNIVIEGPTGTGKTFLACAIGKHLCEHGYSVRYFRLKRLFSELTIAQGDGSYGRLLTKLAKMDLIILDDWGLESMSMGQRNDLLEIMEDRHGIRSTLIASQLPVKLWHETIGDATLADAILDRLIHNAHIIELQGESLRKKKAKLDLA
jgi:DNA replication protein DnaC